MRRIIVSAVAALIVLFGLSTPAQAADNNKLNFYASTWYLSGISTWDLPTPVGPCTSLGGSTIDNAASSVYNWENFYIYVYQTYNCTGEWIRVASNSGIPVLPAGWDNTISSFN